MHQNFEGLSILILLELVQIKKSVLVKRTGLPVRSLSLFLTQIIWNIGWVNYLFGAA